MKLQLFLSHNGGVSRRKAFDHVLAGDVTVNDLAVREPSHMVDPDEDKVCLLGKPVMRKAYEYIMLYKPTGYVTTCEAQFDQWGVMALLPANLRHLKPVGRLDKDTQGLLLLTNDGELAHPSFDVNKTYHVRVVRHLQFREKQRLEEGVVIEKFKTAPAEVANIVKDGDFSEFDITIHEGHKHQVRLMCHEVGHDVVRLTRIAQGPLKLDLAKPGAWRPLTGEELALLHAIGRTTARPRPVFQSNSSERRYSANRDWHSGQAPVPRDPRPRNEQGEHIGSPTGQSRTETVRPQLPARNEPSGRDVRYRPSERPPRENPAGRGERRDPAKPFVRSTGPSASKPYPKTFIGKPSFSKPKGKKPFDRSPGSKPFSRGPKPFGRTSGPRTTGRPR